MHAFMQKQKGMSTFREAVAKRLTEFQMQVEERFALVQRSTQQIESQVKKILVSVQMNIYVYKIHLLMQISKGVRSKLSLRKNLSVHMYIYTHTYTYIYMHLPSNLGCVCIYTHSHIHKTH